MFKSIQTRTMFFLLTFVVCFFIVVVYLITFGIEGTVKSVKSDSLRNEAVILATEINEVVGDEVTLLSSPKYRQNLIEPYVENKSIVGDIFLISKLGDSTGYKDEEIPYDFRFKGDSDVQEIYKNKKNYVCSIVKLRGSSEWFVVIEQLKSEAYGDINTIKTVTIFLVVIAIIVLWNMSKAISIQIQRPIKDLADATVEIASGNISHGIEVDEKGELADIAESFNSVLYKLKNTMQQVMDKSGEALSMAEIMDYVEDTYNRIPVGIIGINQQQDIVMFNNFAADLTGLKTEDIIGRDITNPIPPEIFPLVAPLRKCVLMGSLKLKTLTEINNINGEIIPVLYSISIQFGLSDEVIGGICIFRTIDDIKKFEESAARVKTLETLGEMSASLAHEIRNPLTSIRGYAQFLKAEASEDDSEELDIILHEVDRLNGMLNSFLKFARPKVPEKEPCDINEIIKYVSVLMSKNIPDTIEYATQLETIPKVMVDKELFEPVLINLILNAIQADPEHITVKSHYSKRRKMVSIKVKDDGIGIPPEHSEILFDPFFTTKREGTGMGLPIAARTIEAHGGVIEVESVEGEETKFIILLPALEELE